MLDTIYVWHGMLFHIFRGSLKGFIFIFIFILGYELIVHVGFIYKLNVLC